MNNASVSQNISLEVLFGLVCTNEDLSKQKISLTGIIPCRL